MPEPKKALPPAITTMRLPPEILKFATEAAGDKGLSRTQYIIQLIVQDAKKAGKKFGRLELRPNTSDAAALFD